jgi:PGF-CTERM protein
MKSTSKMMVVAAVFLVAAAMLVMPAAARTATTISSGDTIFLYEQGLNLTPVNNDVKFSSLVYYTEDDTTKGPDVTLSVLDSDDFSLMEDVASKVGTKTGRYFVNGYNTTSGAVNHYVYIKKPAVDLKAVLAESHSDSIAGKTVTSSAKIAFQLIAPDVGGVFVNKTPAAYPTVNIEITTPSGGIVKTLGGVPLSNIALTSSNLYTAAIDLSAEDLESGTYTAVAKWATPKGFDDFAEDSKAVSFTISTDKLSVAASKESVVRGKSFTVTVTGDSKTDYFLYIKTKGTLVAKEYPLLAQNQPGVTVDTTDAILKGMMANTTDFANFTGTFAKVGTKADGTRTVEFRTNTSTKDETFTIKVVENKKTNAKDDDVKVKVEKGAVTITAEGAGSYYFGEEIKLSGTNTEGKKIYFFLVGPNLGDGNGVMLSDVSKAASDGFYDSDSVESDDTWDYTWNTGDIDGGVLSEGSYTVYAVSDKVDKNGKNVRKGNLNDVEYATLSINLRKGFITGATNVNTLAKGDDLKITGTAEGKPDQIYVWVFGKNFYGKDGVVQDSVSVEDDGTFEYKLEDTDNLATGQYFVILQHPMAKSDFADNVMWNGNAMVAPGLNPVNLKNLQASDAATALINAMDSANVDDTYTKLTFMVEEAWIRIDSIGDKAVGEKFTITGTTNLAVGDEMTVDVTSAAFGATTKTETSGFSGRSGTVKVVEGTDFNKWSFEVDATNFKPDQYQVKVEGIDVSDATTTATFNVVEGVTPTPTQPSGNVTTVPPTQTATTTAPATTPTQPGFGALISLIGLGAVAFLVMRRN